MTSSPDSSRNTTAFAVQAELSFGDGESAVRVAAAVRPDVVVADLMLPGMSGAETAAALVALDPSVS